MKIYLFIVISFILSIQAMGQNSKTNFDSLIHTIYNDEESGFKVSMNENGELQFVKIIDSLDASKDELFTRVLSYFAYNYKDSKNVLEQQDKENGIVIGKGHYSTFSTFTNQFTYYLVNVSQSIYYSAGHTIRIDIKNSKIRVIMTISDYSLESIPELAVMYPPTKKIIFCEPFLPDYSQYNNVIVMGVKPKPKWIEFHVGNMKRSEPYALYDLCKRVKSGFDNLEKSIRQGNNKAEKDEW